jgi:hypothetical protein
MDETLAAVIRGRASLICALDELERHRNDLRDDAESLLLMVGDLAAMINRWERERARWT